MESISNPSPSYNTPIGRTIKSIGVGIKNAAIWCTNTKIKRVCLATIALTGIVFIIAYNPSAASMFASAKVKPLTSTLLGATVTLLMQAIYHRIYPDNTPADRDAAVAALNAAAAARNTALAERDQAFTARDAAREICQKAIKGHANVVTDAARLEKELKEAVHNLDQAIKERDEAVQKLDNAIQEQRRSQAANAFDKREKAKPVSSQTVEDPKRTPLEVQQAKKISDLEQKHKTLYARLEKLMLKEEIGSNSDS